MTYNQSSYIRVRYGVFHFVRRVPADVKQHYRSDRVSISLRTKSSKAAIRSAQSISQRLDDYWHGLRSQKMDVPALCRHQLSRIQIAAKWSRLPPPHKTSSKMLYKASQQFKQQHNSAKYLTPTV